MQTSRAPQTEQVLDGLWSIPVPIPGSQLPYVLAYAFAVPDGVVLVDPGWNAPEALAALAEGLAVAGSRLEDLQGGLVTHIHPDHYGLADLAELRDASMQLRRFVVAGQPDRPLADGDRPELPGWRLRALHTPGHTPGHLCFVEERTGVVLTGDHVLPTISPNISRHPQAGPDPLAD